ncbi:MAG: TonB-dependent receptor plug domain-containing protein, partial [Pyrinomonadaceae bacterium]
AYTVATAAASGFAAQEREGVQVALGNDTTVEFALNTTVGATLNVTETSGVILDPTETKAQTNISVQEIDRLPKGTGFTSLLRTTASVRPEPLSGQFSINGATGPENSFIIDGQETQNYRNGLLNANNDIPYQAIQEIQVKTSGFEAEFGGATGGVINAVTKSGSNQFSGEFGVNFNTQKFNAGPRPIPSNQLIGSIPNTGQGFEYLPQTRNGGVSFYPTALLSGPIIKDKLWFFGIHNPRFVDTNATTTYITGFGPTRALATLPANVVALGGTNTQTFRERDTYNYSQFRLDASPFNNLRLNSSYTWNPIVTQGALPANSLTIGTPATLPLNGATFQGAQAAQFNGGRQNSDNFRAEGIYTPTGKLIVLGRYTRGFQNQRLGSYGIPTVTQYVCRNVPTAAIPLAGCAQSFVNVSSNSQIVKDVSVRSTIDAQVSYLFNFGGHHEVKGGYQNSKIFNDVLTGNIGPGRTYLFYADPSNPASASEKYRCFSPNTTYVQWQIQPGNSYPCPANSIGTGVTYQFGASGSATNNATAFFIQDKWQPTTRLTFNLGLRDEQEKIPAFNQNAINLKFSYGQKLAPRIGVAYALTGDGKTKISAFYGRFFDRLKFSLPQGSFGGNFYHVSYFYITADKPNYTNYTVPNLKGTYAFPAGGMCPITSGSAYVCDQDYRIASNVQGANVLTNGAVDPNVKPYRQSEYTVEFQREVMRATIFTARGLYRHLDQAIEDAGVPTDSGEAYVIGNPGQGLALQVYKQLGYNLAPTPQRVYKALQLEVDSRYVKNFSFNLNYTLSRLFGNYSGLASPDEVNTTTGIGRSDPNVTRSFDEPYVGFTASGHPDNGILPLDRTHVFKASGTYTYNWFNSKTNSTDLSFFTTIESGTPKTTFVNIFGIPIPETKRGDLGRTPSFRQTDLNLTHRYRFGRDERFTMAFDFNVLNVFNTARPLAFNQNKSSAYFALAPENVVANGSTRDATNFLTSNGVLSQYSAAEALNGVAISRNLAFNTPIIFQDPRSIRFGFRFLF